MLKAKDGPSVQNTTADVVVTVSEESKLVVVQEDTEELEEDVLLGATKLSEFRDVLVAISV